MPKTGDDIGPVTNAINWIFTSAAICIVLLRFLSRFRLSNFAGWDDLVILIALVSRASEAYGSVHLSPLARENPSNGKSS